MTATSLDTSDELANFFQLTTLSDTVYGITGKHYATAVCCNQCSIKIQSDLVRVHSLESLDIEPHTTIISCISYCQHCNSVSTHLHYALKVSHNHYKLLDDELNEIKTPLRYTMRRAIEKLRKFISHR